MNFPFTNREMYCEHCGVFFEAEGRWVRMDLEDPTDVDFDPEPCCPNCSQHAAVDAEDAPQEEIRKRNEELIGDVLDNLGKGGNTCWQP